MSGTTVLRTWQMPVENSTDGGTCQPASDSHCLLAAKSQTTPVLNQPAEQGSISEPETERSHCHHTASSIPLPLSFPLSPSLSLPVCLSVWWFGKVGGLTPGRRPHPAPIPATLRWPPRPSPEELYTALPFTAILISFMNFIPVCDRDQVARQTHAHTHVPME